ncbi:hypothetical protein [uncultured Roseibium sp.]
MLLFSAISWVPYLPGNYTQLRDGAARVAKGEFGYQTAGQRE